MLASHKMLLRYKALDKCFQSSSEKWTLEMLISHCSKLVGEKISKRSIQSDIQFLRNVSEGYGAPIVVQNKKYYTYKDKSYSILNATLPSKIKEQFDESLDFVKEINDLSTPKHSKSPSLTDNEKKKTKLLPSCIKLHEENLLQTGFFVDKIFFTKNEIRKIEFLLRTEQIKHNSSIIKNKRILKTLLSSKMKTLVKKLNSRAFLVEALYQNSQDTLDCCQCLDLPMRQRKIPQNLTLWGYPMEEEYEKPNKKALYEYTFAIQIFLKDVSRTTGALLVLPGSHKRELSPLEISLISSNSYPFACEVAKGGIVGYKPMLIKKIEPSESPKNKQSITLWFSSYHLPVHYIWNNEEAI